MKNTFMHKALFMRSKSKAKLAKVGAVLVYDDQILCRAYNADLNYEYKELETTGEDGNLVSKPDIIHAEERLIGWCAWSGVPSIDSELYVTLAPCFRCARLILLAGIKKVYYKDSWWDKAAVEYLKNNGVEVIKV